MCAQWAGATGLLRRAGSGRHGRVLMKIDRPGEPLAGYVSGPAAATQATGLALARAVGARAVVLVEGVSDQIAVETLAGRRGRRNCGASWARAHSASSVTRACSSTRSTSTACRSHSTPYSPPFDSRPRIPDNVDARPPASHDRTGVPCAHEFPRWTARPGCAAQVGSAGR